MTACAVITICAEIAVIAAGAVGLVGGCAAATAIACGGSLALVGRASVVRPSTCTLSVTDIVIGAGVVIVAGQSLVFRWVVTLTAYACSGVLVTSSRFAIAAGFVACAAFALLCTFNRNAPASAHAADCHAQRISLKNGRTGKCHLDVGTVPGIRGQISLCTLVLQPHNRMVRR